MSLRYKMKLYEITYLISPDLSEEELKGCQEKITSLIQEEGGVLVDEASLHLPLHPVSQGSAIEVKPPVRKTLAYPIKKKREAFLSTLSFQILPERLRSLEKKLKGESNLLRYQILTKKLPKKVKVISAKKPKKIVKPKPKVELKEIEKKLEEILGET